MTIVTAHQVIDQIKALSSEERTMVRKTFEKSAKEVFDRHVELTHKLSQ